MFSILLTSTEVTILPPDTALVKARAALVLRCRQQGCIALPRRHSNLLRRLPHVFTSRVFGLTGVPRGHKVLVLLVSSSHVAYKSVTLS